MFLEKKLNVFERLNLMPILPKEGSFLTLRLIRDLNAKLGLSAEEMTEFDIVQRDKQITWNEKGSVEKPIDFKEKELDLISEHLEKLDKEKKLEQKHFTLYEKFVKSEWIMGQLVKENGRHVFKGGFSTKNKEDMAQLKSLMDAKFKGEKKMEEPNKEEAKVEEQPAEEKKEEVKAEEEAQPKEEEKVEEKKE